MKVIDEHVNNNGVIEYMVGIVDITKEKKCRVNGLLYGLEKNYTIKRVLLLLLLFIIIIIITIN